MQNRRRAFGLGSLVCLVLASGCAMCDMGHYCEYGAYGGVRPRTDRCCGRVGSAFDDASALAVVSDATPGEPTPALLHDSLPGDAPIIEIEPEYLPSAEPTTDPLPLESTTEVSEDWLESWEPEEAPLDVADPPARSPEDSFAVETVKPVSFEMTRPLRRPQGGKWYEEED